MKEEYKYAVEGFSQFEDCPEFTNCTKTELDAKRVKKRMEDQGLNVVIRPIAEMMGLNPHYEETHGISSTRR